MKFYAAWEFANTYHDTLSSILSQTGIFSLMVIPEL